jgi:hypothetical protein
MIKLEMNIFNLAYIQILKEKRTGRKFKNVTLAIINRAIKIRHYLDLKERGKAIAEARKNNLV